MARRGWGASIATAIGIGAVTGAAQLGFGYGLGIINWTPPGAGAVEAAWVASLAWATWIAATSVIAGAICAQRLHDRGTPRRPHPEVNEPPSSRPETDPAVDRPAPSASDVDALPPSRSDADRQPAWSPESPSSRDADGDGSGRKISLAVAAAFGALITVLLVAVPARAAVVPATGSPQNVAAGYAAAGILVGLLVAIWALHSRAAASNVIATVGWLWLLAVVAVVDGVLSGRGLTSAQLGIWQISADRAGFWIRDYFYWPGAVLSTGSALLIGALAARSAARSVDRRVGAAASGAAGPLLVAVAYLLAVPRLAGIAPEQLSAHLIAPYAVIAGIGGSVVVAALAQRADRRAAARAGVRVPRQRTGRADDVAERPAGSFGTGEWADVAGGADTGRNRSTAPDGTAGAPAVAEPPTGDLPTAGGPARSRTAAPARARSTSSSRRAADTAAGAPGSEADPTDRARPADSPVPDPPATPTTGPKNRPDRRGR
jgi:hypothetical protein